MALVHTLAADGSSGLNRVCSHYGEAIWALKEVLKQAGWTVTQSGTGTSGTFGASDLITSGAIMNTNNAWFVIRDPGGVRSFLIQRGTSVTVYRIYYSASAGFVGTGFGAVSATVPPSATDQQQTLGSSGSTASYFAVSPAPSFVVNAVAQDAADDGVYGFWHFMPHQQGYNPGCFCLEPVKDGNPLDPDPCVVMGPMTISSGPSSSTLTINQQVSCWYGKGTGSEVYRGVNAAEMYKPSTGSSNLVPPSSFGLVTTRQGEEYEIGICWGWNNTQYAASGGFKGTGRHVRWKSVGFRDYPFLYDRDEATPRYVIKNLTFPWPAGELIYYA